MHDSHPLLDAILDSAHCDPVPLALLEARRMRALRTRRRFAISALALVALCIILSRPGPRSIENPAPQRASGLRLFSTADTTFPLLRFSSSNAARPIALFSSGDEPFVIREINEHTLFELLNSYGPVIVYVGAERQPTLLLLNPAR